LRADAAAGALAGRGGGNGGGDGLAEAESYEDDPDGHGAIDNASDEAEDVREVTDVEERDDCYQAFAEDQGGGKLAAAAVFGHVAQCR